MRRPSSSGTQPWAKPWPLEAKTPWDWSPDGRVLLYTAVSAKTGLDLWVLPLTGEKKPFPVIQTRFDETAGQFSPDGRWVTYESNESGRKEIYVQNFSGPQGKWQVSAGGGTQPRWRRDGQELFYVAPDARLMAVPIKVAPGGKTIDAGAPVPLFLTRLASGNGTGALRTVKQQYAVGVDGRFLMDMVVGEPTASPITVVLNWQEELKRLVPTK